jgi:hypothetical protein
MKQVAIPSGITGSACVSILGRWILIEMLAGELYLHPKQLASHSGSAGGIYDVRVIDFSKCVLLQTDQCGRLF